MPPTVYSRELVGLGDNPLMSMLSPKIQSALATCVALLQLSVLPATYVLHLGCQHHCSHPGGASACGHGSSCPFHRHRQESNESPRHEGGSHHDSDQCGICQAAFAWTITTPQVAELVCVGTTEILSQSSSVKCESADRYRQPDRGPPVC